MKAPTLHYIHDPLCGWCYAVEPLLQAAITAGVRVALHGGGLWEEPTHLPDGRRRAIREADGRIAQMTGQAFGPAYLDGLLAAPDTVWHSRPTIAPVLAAERFSPDLAPEMMSAIQRAHYVDGRAVAKAEVLAEIAAGLGLPPDEFATAMRSVPVDRHIEDTRELMGRLGLRGFPTLLLEDEGKFRHLQHEPFYGRP